MVSNYYPECEYISFFLSKNPSQQTTLVYIMKLLCTEFHKTNDFIFVINDFLSLSNGIYLLNVKAFRKCISNLTPGQKDPTFSSNAISWNQERPCTVDKASTKPGLHLHVLKFWVCSEISFTYAK